MAYWHAIKPTRGLQVWFTDSEMALLRHPTGRVAFGKMDELQARHVVFTIR